MKKILSVFMIVLFILMIGCNKNANSGTDNGYNEAPGNTETEIGNDIEDGINVNVNRKIYYNINYRLFAEEENMNKTINDFSAKVSSLNGYIESSNKSFDSQTSVCNYATYVYRVPTEKINELMDFVEEVGGIINSTLSSTDITTKYSSTVERINTLTARKQAYNNMLENNDLSMGEILAINNQIDDIVTELNTLQRQKESYDSLLDYSIVSVEITSKNTNVYHEESTWFDKYFNYLKELVIVLVNVIMYTLPFTILAGTTLLIIFKVKKRKNKIKE